MIVHAIEGRSVQRIIEIDNMFHSKMLFFFCNAKVLYFFDINKYFAKKDVRLQKSHQYLAQVKKKTYLCSRFIIWIIIGYNERDNNQETGGYHY